MLIETFRKYQRDMTQNEYARHLGITSGTLSLIYSGQRGIGTEVLRAFLQAFPEAATEIGVALAEPIEKEAIAV